MTNARVAELRVATGPRLHLAETGEANGTPVLFLHGWPDSSFTFTRVLDRLSPRVRAFVLDQRGFGDSERPDDGYGVQQFADDAIAFLDAVGVARATIVGHSFGSFVARCAALARPDRVDHLVLIGTGLTSNNSATREVLASLQDLEDPLPVQFVREFQASTAYLPVPESFFERIVEESLKAPARVWRATFEGLLAYDDRARLSALATPTLLIWGPQDALFPREDQDRLVETIPSARFHLYEETGHCPNWERPDRVAADIEEFIGIR